MSYTPYYPNGWQSGKAGGTPITPAALQHMENGIQNSAPAGFGLGVGSYANASTSYSTQEQLGALVSNGFWAYRNQDVPLVDADPNTKYVKGINIAYSENHETQIGLCVYTGTCIVRERKDGVWQPWEFDNPPMNKNVEYRTTERYGSLPVYAKRVIYTISTSIESGAEYHIPHNISNFQGLVRHYARVDTFPFPLTSTNGGSTVIEQIGSGSIIVRSNNRTQPAASYIFDLYYTKTS
jgi:hypothetical protein